MGEFEFRIRLDDRLLGVLRSRAEELGVSLSELLNRIVSEAIYLYSRNEFVEKLISEVYSLVSDLDRDTFDLLVRTGRHLTVLHFLREGVRAARGIIAECKAMMFLESLGFRIVSYGGGSAYDFIAEKDGVTYFVEVKTRVTRDIIESKVVQFVRIARNMGIDFEKRFLSGSIRYIMVLVSKGRYTLIDLSEAVEILLHRTSSQRAEVESIYKLFSSKIDEICRNISLA